MRKYECPECGELINNGKGSCEPCGKTRDQVQCAHCDSWNDSASTDECATCRHPLKDVLAVLDFHDEPDSADSLLDEKYRVIGKETYGIIVVDEKPNLSRLFFSPRTVLEKAYKELGYFYDLVKPGKTHHLVTEAPFNLKLEPLPTLKKVWDRTGHFEKIKLLRELYYGAEKLLHLGVTRTLRDGEIYVKGSNLRFFPLHADDNPVEEGQVVADLQKYLIEALGSDDFVIAKLQGGDRDDMCCFEEVLERLDEIKESIETRFCIESYGTTDMGPVRENNEDDFFAVDFRFFQPDGLALGGRSLKQRGLYIVCDGMGGHQKGEVASALIVRELRKKILTYLAEELPPNNFDQEIKEIVKEANDVLLEVNILEGIPAHEGRMGTTLVAFLAFENEAFITHVGDSRCYKYEKGELTLMTEDHNLANQALHAGTFKTREEAEHMRGGKVLTQAIGPREGTHLVPDVRRDLIRGDCYILLCSDGLTDVVKEPEIKEIIESGDGNLRRIARRLIKRAYKNTTRDNITVVLIRFTQSS